MIFRMRHAFSCDLHTFGRMTYDCLPCPGEGILNLAWVGWEIWTETVKSFQMNRHVLSFNTEMLKGEKFTFASRWFRRKGLNENHGRVESFRSAFVSEYVWLKTSRSHVTRLQRSRSLFVVHVWTSCKAPLGSWTPSTLFFLLVREFSRMPYKYM